MRRFIRRLAGLSLVAAAAAALAAQEVTLSTAAFRLVVGADGRPRHLVDAASGRECLDGDRQGPLAAVVVDGTSAPLASVVAVDGGVEMGFAGVDTRLTLGVEPDPVAGRWLRFAVRGIAGRRPERVTILSLSPAIRETVGTRLCAAYDRETLVGLMAATPSTQCVGRGGARATLTALTQDAPGPRLEGAAVALVVCPTAAFEAVAQAAAHAFGLPVNEDAEGRPAKATAAVRGSYWFMAFGEADVDRLIEYSRQAGLRQVLLPSGAWCESVGHYTINKACFPGGLDGLRQSVERLNAAGIMVGMHCFASKIGKRDAYVTPVPDRRFWRRFTAVLAEDVDATQTTLRVRGDLSEWAGHPRSADQYWEGGIAKHREVVLGDEIVRYESIGPEGVWDRFEGCLRGAWGTAASAHAAETPAWHYGVDGCINGYIIDQETTLLDEAQARLAEVFNAGGFEMVYFDGGEDVDRRRYHYYITNFQARAMARFTRRPILHMGTAMTHHLWHSFARSATVDTYLNTLSGAIVGGKPPATWPTVREHIDRSVRYLLSVRADRVPGELGWFGLWPARDFHGQRVDGLQLDEMEYLLCRSLAYDAPISLQTDFRSLDEHSLTPGLLALVRSYEALRLSGAMTGADLAAWRVPGRDGILLRDGAAPPRLVGVTPLAAVGGGRAVRGTVGAYGSGALASLWHSHRRGAVTLDLASAAGVRALDLEGRPLPVLEVAGGVRIEVGAHRVVLVCPGLSPAALQAALAGARVVSEPPVVLVVPAAAARRLQGSVALGSSLGLTDPGAWGDVLVGTAAADFVKANDWYAEYSVDIPHDGLWTIWSRQRYPSGTDQSFALVPEGEAATFQGRQVLGNCGRNDAAWHWAGQGGGSTTEPPGRRLTMPLRRGRFTFRIHPRECGAAAATNPRLDAIVFVDDAQLEPSDEALRPASAP